MTAGEIATKFGPDQPLALALVQALEEAGKIERSALTLTDDALPVERYELFLELFGQFKRTLSFVLGDLINFGLLLYSEEGYDHYDRAVELTGLTYDTLRNYARVCRMVAKSRRRDSLSFGHHTAVASLDPDGQDHWLAAAEENGWGREELRERLREANALPSRSKPEWSNGRFGSLAPEVEQPPLPPADPALPSGAVPAAPTAPLAATPADPSASLRVAVQGLLEAGQPVDAVLGWLQELVEEVAALGAVEE